MEREILLDAKGRFTEKMYDQLAAEVKAASDAEYEELAAVLEYYEGMGRRDAEAEAHWRVMYGTPRPKSRFDFIPE